jgi:hypothetical protein
MGASRQIGMDRKRSEMPLDRSVLRPIPAYMLTSRTAITSVPGRMNLRYRCGEPASAPPNR